MEKQKEEAVKRVQRKTERLEGRPASADENIGAPE